MTLWRSLPPLAALRAFAAFVDTGTVSRAGAELNVSHAAISQQLRALETHLGLALFDRRGRELALTAEGRLLAEATTAGFDGIAKVVEVLTGAQAGRPLQLTTTPSFAAVWLMPRLADFRAHHPEIDIAIDPSGAMRTLGPGGYDVALRFGDGDWPGLESRLLVRSRAVVVAAPSLVGKTKVTDMDELARFPWMQELGTNEASAFLQARGMTQRAGLTSLPGNMMIDAARNGQGIAVTARAIVEADIAAGRLSLLFEDDKSTGYFLVTPKGILRPAAQTFVRWALRQTRERATGG